MSGKPDECPQAIPTSDASARNDGVTPARTAQSHDKPSSTAPSIDSRPEQNMRPVEETPIVGRASGLDRAELASCWPLLQQLARTIVAEDPSIISGLGEVSKPESTTADTGAAGASPFGSAELEESAMATLEQLLVVFAAQAEQSATAAHTGASTDNLQSKRAALVSLLTPPSDLDPEPAAAAADFSWSTSATTALFKRLGLKRTVDTQSATTGEAAIGGPAPPCTPANPCAACARHQANSLSENAGKEAQRLSGGNEDSSRHDPSRRVGNPTTWCQCDVCMEAADALTDEYSADSGDEGSESSASIREELFDAVECADAELVAQLLDSELDLHGAKLDFTCTLQHDTPLIVAAKKGNADIVEMLVDAGANTAAVNTYGRTALHEGCIAQRLSVTTTLAEDPAVLLMRDTKGCTPLCRAAISKAFMCAAYLVWKRGDEAYVNLRSSSQDTPLSRACVLKHWDMAAFLVYGLKASPNLLKRIIHQKYRLHLRLLQRQYHNLSRACSLLAGLVPEYVDNTTGDLDDGMAFMEFIYDRFYDTGAELPPTTAQGPPHTVYSLEDFLHAVDFQEVSHSSSLQGAPRPSQHSLDELVSELEADAEKAQKALQNKRERRRRKKLRKKQAAAQQQEAQSKLSAAIRQEPPTPSKSPELIGANRKPAPTVSTASNSTIGRSANQSLAQASAPSVTTASIVTKAERRLSPPSASSSTMAASEVTHVPMAKHSRRRRRKLQNQADMLDPLPQRTTHAGAPKPTAVPAQPEHAGAAGPGAMLDVAAAIDPGISEYADAGVVGGLHNSQQAMAEWELWPDQGTPPSWTRDWIAATEPSISSLQTSGRNRNSQQANDHGLDIAQMLPACLLQDVGIDVGANE